MSHQDMTKPGFPPQGGGVENQAFSPEVDMTSRGDKKPSDKVQFESLAGPTSTSKEERLTSEVDKLQKKLGGYGRYQVLIYVILGVVYMRGSWHVLVPTFQAMVPDFHCKAYPGRSLAESIPANQSCNQYIYRNNTRTDKTESCTNGWNMTFSRDEVTSIVSEYDLVCDREYLAELSTVMYMVGTTCGVVFLTPLSERLGAKSVMITCLFLQLVVGVALPWSGTIAVFILLKFFIGIFNMTIALCVAVLMSETFDASHRELPALGITFFWAAGIMSLALLGYLLPNWKDLQLAISVPINALGLIFIWLIPSSLPWLLSKGKVKKAEQVIKRFLAFNSLPAIPNLQEKLAQFSSNKDNNNPSSAMPTTSGSLNEESQFHSNAILVQDPMPTNEVAFNDAPTYTIFELFKHSSLRIYTIILCYLFLVNALSYFGIYFNIPSLDGDPYLNLFFMGLVEVPAYLLCILSNRYFGRRRPIFVFLIICSVANIPIPFIPEESSSGADLSKLKMFLVMVGKFGVTGSYSAIYLYASEVFPTAIRNQAVGFCSFFENIGSIAAPYTVNVNEKMKNLPLTLYGVLTILGAIAMLYLPETHNVPLPQTIEDAESRGRNRKSPS